MASPKHQKYFQDMIETHKELFDEFRCVHDGYLRSPDQYKSQFNEVGAKVLPIIRQYEKMLTSEMSGSQYGRFSNNLSDKFWETIRRAFPKIDFIGVK